MSNENASLENQNTKGGSRVEHENSQKITAKLHVCAAVHDCDGKPCFAHDVAVEVPLLCHCWT